MTTAPSGDDATEGKQLFRFGSMEARTRSLTHSGLVLIGAFLLGSLLAGVGQALLESLGFTEETAPLVMELVPMSLHFTGLIAGVALFLSREDEWALLKIDRPSLRDVLWVVLGFVALVVSLNGLDVILTELGQEPAQNAAVEAGRENPQLFLYFIPVVVLLNAPAEELLFRGLIQGLFRRAYGVVPAILAAAAVFGLVHYVALVGTGSKLAYVSVAILSGLVLGGLYEYTDNLTVPLAVHACWNVFVYLTLYAEHGDALWIAP